MNDTTVNILRVIAAIAMGYGAWKTWRSRGPSYRYDGRKYYRLPDGRFTTPFGRIVKDPGTCAGLAATVQAAETAKKGY